MKILLLFCFVIFSVSSTFACNNSVDPSKVVLFIDTNNSELEIATAQKAACERGEQLRVVPDNYKEYKQLIQESNKAKSSFKSCEQQKNDCDALKAKSVESYKALMDFNNKFAKTEVATREALVAIQKDKAKVTSVIISGHDGGGKFSGSKGAVDKKDLQNLFDEFPDTNNIRSLLLLGCYTGTQKEVMDWKGIFPHVSLIAGYDASAPLAIQPAGQKFLSDLLLKEKALLSQADKKKLENYTKKNLDVMANLNAAIYVVCEEDKNGYYYSSRFRDEGLRKLDMSSCEDVKKLKSIYAKAAPYLSGELEPPKDTVKGALRMIYNEARAYEHCFEYKNIPLNVSNLFNLLFHEDVKKSFAHLYGKDLEEAEKIIAKIDPEVLRKHLEEQIPEYEKQILFLKEILKEQEKDPAGYLAKKQKDLLELEKKKSQKQGPTVSGPKFGIPAAAASGFASGLMDLSDPTKLNDIETLNTQIGAAKAELEMLSKDPNSSANNTKAAIQELEKKIEVSNKYSRVSSKEPLKPWVPTAKNLRIKNRKEILENIHILNEALTNPELSDEQREKLDWVKTKTATHLQYFQNPFSWHEYNGVHVELPEGENQ